MAKKKKTEVSEETLEIILKGKQHTLRNKKEIEGGVQWQLSAIASRGVVNSFYSGVSKYNDKDLFKEGDKGFWAVHCISTNIGDKGNLIYLVTLQYKEEGWLEKIDKEYTGPKKAVKIYTQIDMTALIAQLNPV